MMTWCLWKVILVVFGVFFVFLVFFENYIIINAYRDEYKLLGYLDNEVLKKPNMIYLFTGYDVSLSAKAKQKK